MNYTENYHLPQWEETDRIMRTDFNQMCADMEAGLEKNAQAAAAAKARGDKGVTDAAAAKAAADSAKSAAQVLRHQGAGQRRCRPKNRRRRLLPLQAAIRHRELHRKRRLSGH